MLNAAAAHRLSCGKSAEQAGGQRYLSPGHTRDAWDAVIADETAPVLCNDASRAGGRICRFFSNPNSRVDCLCCVVVACDGTVTFYHSKRAPCCSSTMLQPGGSLSRHGRYLCPPIVKHRQFFRNPGGLQLWSLRGSRCVP